MERYPAFLVLLPGVVWLGAESVRAKYVAARRYPGFLTACWLGAFGFSVALDVTLVPRFGFLAGGASRSVCYGTILCELLMAFHRDTGHGVRDLWIPSRERV